LKTGQPILDKPKGDAMNTEIPLFRQGVDAFFDNTPCPYQPGTKEYTEWNEGFRYAKNDMPY
jgi:hypothetical protein